MSRCVNTPTKVAASTREAVEQAIERLGYTPHFGGRAVASNRTHTVGPDVPVLTNAMFAMGLQSFQDTLSEAGVTLLVASSGFDPEREAQQLRRLLANGVDGLMLIGHDRSRETRDFLALRAVPHVLTWCSGPPGPVPVVGFDNRAAARDMARHVIAKGHRRLAIIAGLCANNDRARARLAGFHDAVAETAGRAEIVAQTEAAYVLDEGGDAFDRLRVTSCGATALLCGNDVLAAGAIVRARRDGIEVPRDLSVTGFDDIGLARVSYPALTTMHVPQEDMGRRAAEVLLARIENAPHPYNVTLPTRLVVRDSLTPP